MFYTADESFKMGMQDHKAGFERDHAARLRNMGIDPAQYQEGYTMAYLMFWAEAEAMHEKRAFSEFDPLRSHRFPKFSEM